MEKENVRKYFNIFVIVALAFSVITNILLLARFSQLKYEVNDVMNNQHLVMDEVSSQTSRIQHVMNEINQEQSWISTITMDLNTKDREEGQAEAIFKWQVKEIHNQSEVYFDYTYGDNEDFIALPAEEIQKGLYQVKIPIEIRTEPLWDVRFIPSDNNTLQEMNKQEIEERLKETTFKYFVSLSHEDILKSGEIQTEQLDYVGTEIYGMLQTELYQGNNDPYSVILTHHLNNSSNTVEEAYLLKYENQKLIEEEELQLQEQDEMIGIFQLNQVEANEHMRLTVKVIYSDGASFEKEIH